MKTTIAILACLTLTSISTAQTPTTKKAEPVERLNYSYREIERDFKTFRPMPVTIITNDGIRTYNTQAEADRGEKLLREKRESLEKSIKEQQKVYEQRAEERSNNAMWKLVAFGAGLFIGIMRIIWGLFGD